jgi:hypothetical protein
MEVSLQNLYFNALKKRYESQIEEARANLALYFSNTNLAAIGEHSDLLTEHDRWITKLAESQDKLQTLMSLISQNQING